MLERPFNKVAVQKRLQHRCFPVKFAKFLKAVRLSAINFRFSWKKIFAVTKSNTLVRKITPEFFYTFSILRFFEFCYNELVLLKVWVWYRCQKWIERYYHHAGEQLTFYQKVHVKTHSLRKGECFCNLCIAVSSNLFDKDRTQYNVKWHIQQEGSWLSWIVTEQVKCK